MKNATKARVEGELDKLINLGEQIYFKLLLKSGQFDFDDPPLGQDDDEEDEDYAEYLLQNEKKKSDTQKARDFCKDIGNFATSYERFYTLALKVVKTLAPARIDDFIKQYRDDRRKEVTVATYLISDAIVGYKHSYGNYDQSSALPRLWTQIGILIAVKANLENTLNDIDTLVRADLFDSEIESARHLLSRGHLRAAGAVAGVVLESHLAVVSDRHGFKSRKQNPTIADFNEFLKSEGIFDVVTWRRIQGLADIRNACDHQKGRDPSNDDVEDLIRGVDRVIKEVS